MIYFIFLRGKERGEEVEKRKKKMKQKVSDLIRCGSSFVASGALSGLLSFSGRNSNKSLAFRRRADNDSVNLITTNEQSEYGQFTLRRLRTTISFIYLFSETQFFSFPSSFVFSFSLLGKRKMNNQKLAMTMTVKRDYN